MDMNWKMPVVHISSKDLIAMTKYTRLYAIAIPSFTIINGSNLEIKGQIFVRYMRR